MYLDKLAFFNHDYFFVSFEIFMCEYIMNVFGWKDMRVW